MKRILSANWAKTLLIFAMVWSVGTALVLSSTAFGKVANSGNKLTAKNPCNPCNPCGAKNPCNPCAAKNPCNPCNPCAAKNPCNPCNPCAAKNPCNPCNLCAAKKRKWYTLLVLDCDPERPAGAAPSLPTVARPDHPKPFRRFPIPAAWFWAHPGQGHQGPGHPVKRLILCCPTVFACVPFL